MKVSKVPKAEVELWINERPHLKKRNLMYTATGERYEISADLVERIITFHRRLQDILPNDKKGVELQKEWLANEGMEDIVSLATKALTPPGYVRRDGHLFKIIT